MMNTGTWMMNGYSRGHDGMMFGNHYYGMGGDFDMFGPMSLITISIFSILFILAMLWAIAIKGYALWQAAKRGEKWWFIALLIINTFGILELAYLFFVAKVWSFGGKKKDVVHVNHHNHTDSHAVGHNTDSKEDKAL
jgi:hypothetical protein